MTMKWFAKCCIALVLSLWSLMGQAQTKCVDTFGQGSIVATSPMSKRVLVVVRNTLVLTGATSCGLEPTAFELVNINGGIPYAGVTTFTQNGVTVDLTKAKIRNRGNVPAGCSVQGDGTNRFIYNCTPGNSANGQTVTFDMEYLLEGTSNTSTSVKFFQPSLRTFIDINQSSTYSICNFCTPQIDVPLSTAPTCSTTIDPPNVALGTIKPTDLSGAVGSFTTLGQKPLKLTMACMANALGQASTFVPTFQFNNPLSAGAYDISRAVTTDPGFGFRVLDPSGNAIKSGVALSSVTFPFTASASAQSISRSFTVQYAKTLANITPSLASSTITVTISFQ